MDLSYKDTNTWSYRIFKHPGKDGNADTYALHECYLQGGQVKGSTINPQSAHYETVEELIGDLEKMLRDAQNSQGSILDYSNADGVDSGDGGGKVTPP